MTLQDIHNFDALQSQRETAERVAKLSAFAHEVTVNFNDPTYAGF